MSELLSACSAVAVRDGFGLSSAELLSGIEEILTAQAVLAGALSRQLRVAISTDATTLECGRATRSWLVEEMRLSPSDAKRRCAAAYTAAERPALDAAAVAGDIHAEHSCVIGTCLRQLPADWQDTGEQVLVEAARCVDPATLGKVAMELRLRSGADESRDAAEARRYAGRFLNVASTFEGMLRLDGMLDPESGRTLLTALNPLTHPGGDDDLRSLGQRRADALTDLARRALDTDTLPDHNSARPQLVVTIDWDTLRTGVDTLTGSDGTAQLSGSNVPLTPAAARRIACDAGIIPTVLAGRSETLDIGRTTRVWTTAQRRAAHLRDQGCVYPRCSAGPDHTDLHHLHHWADGGPTSLENAATLCRYHHWLIHHTPWDLQRQPGGGFTASRS